MMTIQCMEKGKQKKGQWKREHTVLGKEKKVAQYSFINFNLWTCQNISESIAQLTI